MPVPGSFADLSITPSANSPQGTENVGTIMNQYLQAAYAFIAQLNANMTPLGTLTAPSGTRLVMNQASAPAGWTVDASATLNDCAMRFNSSTGGATGGASAWSNWNFGGTFTTGSTAITQAQMPVHNHAVSDPGHTHGVADGGHSHGLNDPGHNHGGPGGTTFFVNSPGGGNYSGGSSQFTTVAQTAIGYTGISMNAASTGISLYGAATGVGTYNAGSGAGHTHTFAGPQVKYSDCIVAIKS